MGIVFILANKDKKVRYFFYDSNANFIDFVTCYILQNSKVGWYGFPLLANGSLK